MRTSIKSINFKSSNGQDTISAAVYCPEGEQVRGVLQLCHGMSEHIGRYHAFMLYMAHHGLAVFAHDQLGHGKSAPDPQRLGYFAPQNGYQCLLRDAHQLSQIAQSLFPQRRLFLLGHSMGSLVARLYCVKYPQNLGAAIFLGTPGPNPAAGVGRLLAQRHMRGHGELSRPALLEKLTTGNMNRRFTPVRTPFDWLTRDEAVVDKYIKDPLCGFPFTAAGYHDLYAMVEIANSTKWYKDYPKELPTLILAGDCDPVGDFGRGTMQVYHRLRSAGAVSLSCQLYEGARHELLNELNREEVCGDILAFLEPLL